jgi:hypothetical protein
VYRRENLALIDGASDAFAIYAIREMADEIARLSQSIPPRQPKRRGSRKIFAAIGKATAATTRSWASVRASCPE